MKLRPLFAFVLFGFAISTPLAFADDGISTQKKESCSAVSDLYRGTTGRSFSWTSQTINSPGYQQENAELFRTFKSAGEKVDSRTFNAGTQLYSECFVDLQPGKKCSEADYSLALKQTKANADGKMISLQDWIQTIDSKINANLSNNSAYDKDENPRGTGYTIDIDKNESAIHKLSRIWQGGKDSEIANMRMEPTPAVEIFRWSGSVISGLSPTCAATVGVCAKVSDFIKPKYADCKSQGLVNPFKTQSIVGTVVGTAKKNVSGLSSDISDECRQLKGGDWHSKEIDPNLNKQSYYDSCCKESRASNTYAELQSMKKTLLETEDSCFGQVNWWVNRCEEINQKMPLDNAIILNQKASKKSRNNAQSEIDTMNTEWSTGIRSGHPAFSHPINDNFAKGFCSSMYERNAGENGTDAYYKLKKDFVTKESRTHVLFTKLQACVNQNTTTVFMNYCKTLDSSVSLIGGQTVGNCFTSKGEFPSGAQAVCDSNQSVSTVSDKGTTEPAGGTTSSTPAGSNVNQVK